ncbi:uncharacterized protein LOC110870994 [Helianthus annuus]|uniref:uncharacterized protein LOC110870994 n=1 Tax=Helianthus annuus TaxID=4232 RepID=UPI0016532D12|nr:uncharacterized protein LOC110870994 [Helianthus annuus]
MFSGTHDTKSSKSRLRENSSMASPKMSLKLLVDRKGSRVLFAEVPKEFVDILFRIFSLPLGTLIESVGSEWMVGCLGKLKDSIESLRGNYLQPGIKMEDVFNHKTTFNGDIFRLSYDEAQSGSSKPVYRCPNATRKYYDSDSNSGSRFGYDYDYRNYKACESNVTLYVNTKCPNCRRSMNVPMTVVRPKEVLAETKKTDQKRKRGYVKEVATYMVMDDLVVKPMSTISSITAINKFSVEDLSQLEEMTVSFGKEEGLKLLKASLKTDKVLTAIFMH